MYTVIEKDPITGVREFEVRDCEACEGSGEEEWHLGCGDSGPPTCRKCDGAGQYTKRWRSIYPKSKGPWQN